MPIRIRSGLSGSGKTWLAQRLAMQTGAVHVRSDVERKRAAGVHEHAATGSGIGAALYAAEKKSGVYEHLAQCAEHVLAGGYSVIVDATFSTSSQREIFSQLARKMDHALHVLVCEAPAALLKERIARRQETASDASEADLAVLEWQRQHYEPITAAETLNVIEVATNGPDPLNETLRALRSRTAR